MQPYRNAETMCSSQQQCFVKMELWERADTVYLIMVYRASIIACIKHGDLVIHSLVLPLHPFLLRTVFMTTLPVRFRNI